jgi:hypothetical protein
MKSPIADYTPLRGSLARRSPELAEGAKPADLRIFAFNVFDALYDFNDSCALNGLNNFQSDQRAQICV